MSEPNQIWEVIELDEEGFVSLDGRRVACIPVTLVDMVNINIIHTAKTQDWSFKAWVSTTPYGNPITLLPPAASWAPPRQKLYSVCVHTTDEPYVDPEGFPVYGIPATPGLYYINVQNMVNTRNGAYVLLTDGEGNSII